MTNQEIGNYINKELKHLITLNALDEGMLGHIYNMCTDIRDCLINDRIPCSFVKHILNENWDRAKAVADKWNKDTLEQTTFYSDYLKHLKKSSAYIQKMREKNISLLIN